MEDIYSKSPTIIQFKNEGNWLENKYVNEDGFTINNPV